MHRQCRGCSGRCFVDQSLLRSNCSATLFVVDSILRHSWEHNAHDTAWNDWQRYTGSLLKFQLVFEDQYTIVGRSSRNGRSTRKLTRLTSSQGTAREHA